MVSQPQAGSQHWLALITDTTTKDIQPGNPIVLCWAKGDGNMTPHTNLNDYNDTVEATFLQWLHLKIKSASFY